MFILHLINNKLFTKNIINKFDKEKYKNQFLAQEKNSKLNKDAKKVSKVSVKKVKECL